MSGERLRHSPEELLQTYLSGARKKSGSDCELYITCPASVDVKVRKNYRKSICPAGALNICRSDGVRRAENTLKYLFAKILDSRCQLTRNALHLQ